MSDNQSDNHHEDDEPPSRRSALIAIVAILVLLGGCLWLTKVLHGMGEIQDCVMSGRTNCAPIQAGTR